MKRILFYFSLFYLLLFFGCNDTIDEMTDKQPANNVTGVSVDNNGFLVFKDQAAYRQISSLVDSMNDQEFLNWEQSLGFLSAQTFLSKVDAEVEKLETLSQFETLKNKYSGKLIFTNDGDIKLPFYATAWSRILSPEGIMKIGDMLYKFDQEKEVAIADGKYEDITKSAVNYTDNEKVKVYYPFKREDNLKSTVTHLLEGTQYSSDEKSKLEYDLQLINFYYKGYGASSVYYTEVGYQLRFELTQKRKNIIGIWYKNETVYNINDIHLNYKYTTINEFKIGSDTDGLATVGHINSDGTITTTVEDFCTYVDENQPNILSDETNTGIYWNIFDYYACELGSYPQIVFKILDFDFLFTSRGIGWEKAVQISNYQY